MAGLAAFFWRSGLTGFDGVALRDLPAGETAFFFDEVGLSVIVEAKCPLVALEVTAFFVVFPDAVDCFVVPFEETFGVACRDFVDAAGCLPATARFLAFPAKLLRCAAFLPPLLRRLDDCFDTANFFVAGVLVFTVVFLASGSRDRSQGELQFRTLAYNTTT